jgi:hypothetical protein
LRQVSGFLHVLSYPPPITARVSVFQRIVHYITVSIVTLCVVRVLDKTMGYDATLEQGRGLASEGGNYPENTNNISIPQYNNCLTLS